MAIYKVVTKELLESQMRYANPHAAMAAQCINAVHLAADPARLQQARDRELVTAAATLAKGLVLAGLHR